MFSVGDKELIRQKYIYAPILQYQKPNQSKRLIDYFWVFALSLYSIVNGRGECSSFLQ